MVNAVYLLAGFGGVAISLCTWVLLPLGFVVDNVILIGILDILCFMFPAGLLIYTACTEIMGQEWNMEEESEEEDL